MMVHDKTKKEINTLLVLMKCLPAPEKLEYGESDVQRCIRRMLKKESRRLFNDILFIKEWVENENEVGYRYVARRSNNVYAFLVPERINDD